MYGRTLVPCAREPKACLEKKQAGGHTFAEALVTWLGAPNGLPSHRSQHALHLARPWALASFGSAAASSVCTTAGHKQSVSLQDGHKQHSHASATPTATKGVSQPSCPLAIP